MASLITPVVLVSSCCYDTTLFKGNAEESRVYFTLQATVHYGGIQGRKMKAGLICIPCSITTEQGIHNQESPVGTMEEDAYLLAH